ncbi:discoidin domain-containing protein [Streptomyces sp. NPDC058686]|uniref:discoidin domain-containing protein n=1 Tax=Streptomyces sp. NPDC058686 TaxID=3346599 RepID=UPI0036642AF7
MGTGPTEVATTLAAPANSELSAGKPATASAGPADAAFDGVSTTKWQSGRGDRAWLRVDLGRPQTVTKVDLDWAPAHGRDYAIQVSGDGTTWTTVARRTDRTSAGSDTLTARYVRLVGTEAAREQDGYALWSMRVFDVPDLALHRPTTASSSEVPSQLPALRSTRCHRRPAGHSRSRAPHHQLSPGRHSTAQDPMTPTDRHPPRTAQAVPGLQP